MIYLDTHILVWLYAGEVGRLSAVGQQLLRQHDLLVSPIVSLEVQYLYEIQRIQVDAPTLMADLRYRLGMKVCEKPFDRVVERSWQYDWTRDPFDRLIVAQASLDDDLLLTKDETIRAHYLFARW